MFVCVSVSGFVCVNAMPEGGQKRESEFLGAEVRERCKILSVDPGKSSIHSESSLSLPIYILDMKGGGYILL